jgi:hypothetical protein
MNTTLTAETAEFAENEFLGVLRDLGGEPVTRAAE